jgi:hypothetical protein
MPNPIGQCVVRVNHDRLPSFRIPDQSQLIAGNSLSQLRTGLWPADPDVAFGQCPKQGAQHDLLYEVELPVARLLFQQVSANPIGASLLKDPSDLAELLGGQRKVVWSFRHTSQEMNSRFVSKFDPVTRAQSLREDLRDPVRLEQITRQALSRLPETCEVVVAFSVEGYAVAAACSALAMEEGRPIRIERATLLAPLASGDFDGSSWASIEEALGFGPPRSWVVEWAESRGAGARCELSDASLSSFAEVV